MCTERRHGTGLQHRDLNHAHTLISKSLARTMTILIVRITLGQLKSAAFHTALTEHALPKHGLVELHSVMYAHSSRQFAAREHNLSTAGGR